MKINAEQLPSWLRQQRRELPALIWVAGDEPLLLQEACDLLRRAARQLGYDDRTVYHVDRQFDWHALLHESQSLSLFAQRRLIELRLSNGKLEEAGRKMLQAHIAHADGDTLIQVSSPRLESATTRSKWFQQLESAGVLVQVWPVDLARMPGWLMQRLQSRGLNASAEAVELLCDRTQGNLLAAAQEVEKLALLRQGSTEQIGAAAVLDAVADNARFNVFQLIDHALIGDATAALRSLRCLLAEGNEILLVLAMVSRELRSLHRMCMACANGSSVATAMKAERVWQNRQRAVAAALSRLNSEKIAHMLQQAREVDLAAKGQSTLPPELLLERLLLSLSGRQPAT